MALTISNSAIQPHPGTYVWVHLTANETFTVVGNDSVSNLASNGEILTGATIRKAVWGTSGNTGQFWSVARGSNNVLVLSGTGNLDFQAMGTSMDRYPAATIDCKINNGVTGFLMLQIKKQPESLQSNSTFGY